MQMCVEVNISKKHLLFLSRSVTIKDNAGKACDATKSYVEVTKNDDEYVMKVNLSCDDMEDYILVNIGCYDFCDSGCNTANCVTVLFSSLTITSPDVIVISSAE